MLVSPGRVGCDDPTRVGWRVGASSTAVVGLLVAIVGWAVGCVVAGAGEGLPLGDFDGAPVGLVVVVGLLVTVEGVKVVGGVVGAAVGWKAAPGTVGCGVAGWREGKLEGRLVGRLLGCVVGCSVGFFDGGEDGCNDGAIVDRLGLLDGGCDGCTVGVTGGSEGRLLGCVVGCSVGCLDGETVGREVGRLLGCSVGRLVGCEEGCNEGEDVLTTVVGTFSLVGWNVGLLVSPGIVGRLVVVGTGVATDVGNEGLFVWPTIVGWRVGACCAAVVGLALALVGLSVGRLVFGERVGVLNITGALVRFR